VSIDLDALTDRVTVRRSAWTSRDTLLYALAVGAGTNPDWDELDFTTENSHDADQRVLPTFAVVGGGATDDALGDATDADDNTLTVLGSIPLGQIVHGEQSLTVRAALAVAGRSRSQSRITGVYDTGRHAIIESTSVLYDADTDAVLAESLSSVVALGAGGFGGRRAPTEPWPTWSPPDGVVSVATASNQALLYRLTGDRNPLHSDPWFARQAGQTQPILHGLCSYGFVGRVLLHTLCGGDVARFGQLSARFSSPVIPGDVLTTSLWTTPAGARFQVAVGDRIVLDRGVFRFRSG
jgi:acyl dehydratase